MSDDLAIKVENLSKVYKLYNSPVDRLKESLHPLRRQYHQDFYALNNVSFEIKKGESVGIIGKNGSGKSTLLKILTGVLSPTSGSVTVKGKVSALLELGAGFNPELSGAENVYFNGMLMGYTREEMDARLDDILSFADIGEFINQPVKSYSSGMFVRLAFAVAVNIEPEILIVDEALSVGDLFFQQKCFSRMKKILDSDISLLFVSHDLPGVQKLCRRGILLKEGMLAFDGGSVECVSAYTFREKKTFLSERQDTCRESEQNGHEESENNGKNLITDTCLQQGDKGLEVTRVIFGNSADHQIEFGATADIVIQLKANQLIKFPVVGFSLFDRLNNLVFSTNSYLMNHNLNRMYAGDSLSVSFKPTFAIQPGTYSLSVGCSEMNPADTSDIFIHHRCVGLGPITVTLGSPLSFHGIAQLPCTFELNK